ncbi:Fur family transcriptional regulator [Alkalispirochaeta alkalica]|uniref:Fur family transcriptional regulator n=1 Tax=Alkalispirochaeta alkalica TaxID=46356 RepID=UPI000478232B
MAKVRKSRQRDRIRELLEKERIHVTASWVYDQLREEFPTLSLGNVYRNLNILVRQGEVNRLPFGSTFDVYEAARKPHYHFVCERCGAIEDVAVPGSLQDQLDSLVDDASGHRLHRTTVEFHGICRACRKKATPSPDGQ